ncbi:hypothetical protein Terro_4159 [Terriglobus roseus DSM 18391]|uniref:Uncharacterized protein n=1 Tax=Terriglobus roseus (strain DSM 18391 / NRRL B-41598 / KBS 63) TaxID=926566 RepID=I3ZM97_TERRK|nr:hypothetical protein [Terriglobus roseus]AFL90365.1 hypothetical protein Terro_4159 [Terriglobus roseus DSM 18391]
MRTFRSATHCLALAALLLIGAATGSAQQIVQRGALGTPALVQDDTEQWTTPLLLAEDHDVSIYMPDVSTPQWLQKNYDSFINKGTYVLTLFTFYRTPAACRANQVAWGLGDAAHLNACVDTGYRARRALIDPQSKSVTLQAAVMVDQSGYIQPSTLRDDQLFRTWDQLDGNTQLALKKADEFVTRQLKIYDVRQRSLH